MSGDEYFATIVAIMGCLYWWGSWIFLCFSLRNFGRGRMVRLFGLATPALAGLVLFGVLKTYASHDVRDDGLYLFFYMVMGAAWLGLVRTGSALMGLLFRDDWLERGNPAAAAAGSGVLVGGMAAFGGANIGDGPGWWVVVFCAMLSTGALFVSWWCYAKISGSMERISIDRDLGAGIRLGAYITAVGVIAGRVVAGNWHSAEETLRDFAHDAWPLLLYAIAAGLVERNWTGPHRSAGGATSVGCTLFHAAAAAFYLHWAGPWS
jgi:hypothetical protein